MDETIQMKATGQYFPVALFIMLNKVNLTFKSVAEILRCDNSNESYQAVLCCGAVRSSIFHKKEFSKICRIFYLGIFLSHRRLSDILVCLRVPWNVYFSWKRFAT